VLPQPVFIIAAYDENGIPDAMTSVWGGISNEKEISICISSERKTLKNILLHGAFTVSMADASFVEACDYVGIETANKVPDKFGLTEALRKYEVYKMTHSAHLGDDYEERNQNGLL
jgi:flavin reductase (DIM6/NTAB) family NADH-FMN oxidoreductase RutF